MSKIDSTITKASYVMKRLRDSGFSCEKLIGYSDEKSLESQFEKDIENMFPKGDVYDTELIIQNLKFIKPKIRNFFKYTPDYSEFDQREWTILIDVNSSNILLTLYRNSKLDDHDEESFGSDFFELTDGNQWVKPIRKRINSLSFEVLMEEIIKLGIK